MHHQKLQAEYTTPVLPYYWQKEKKRKFSLPVGEGRASIQSGWPHVCFNGEEELHAYNPISKVDGEITWGINSSRSLCLLMWIVPWRLPCLYIPCCSTSSTGFMSVNRWNYYSLVPVSWKRILRFTFNPDQLLETIDNPKERRPLPLKRKLICWLFWLCQTTELFSQRAWQPDWEFIWIVTHLHVISLQCALWEALCLTHFLTPNRPCWLDIAPPLPIPSLLPSYSLIISPHPGTQGTHLPTPFASHRWPTYPLFPHIIQRSQRKACCLIWRKQLWISEWFTLHWLWVVGLWNISLRSEPEVIARFRLPLHHGYSSTTFRNSLRQALKIKMPSHTCPFPSYLTFAFPISKRASSSYLSRVSSHLKLGTPIPNF